MSNDQLRTAANRCGIDVKLVDQRFDGYEVWLQRSESPWIRIDFMLEYYISRSFKVKEVDRGSMRVKINAIRYGLDFLSTYGDVLSDKKLFNFDDYHEWVSSKKTPEEAVILFPKRKP